MDNNPSMQLMKLISDQLRTRQRECNDPRTLPSIEKNTAPSWVVLLHSVVTIKSRGNKITLVMDDGSRYVIRMTMEGPHS